MTENTRPETPTLDIQEESNVAGRIGERLGHVGEVKKEEQSDAPQAKNPRMIDLNNMSTEQIQDMQEMFAQTPRRVRKKEEYHTIELREIDGKVIVEWGNSYFDLKHDSTQRRDVMKTMIPVRFSGDDKFVDILWNEEFMQANKVTCRIIKMDNDEQAEIVGTTIKRGKDGEETAQEVEMYVNRVVVTLTVKLPNGDEAILDGKFAN